MGNALLLGSPTQVLDAEQLIAAFENSPEGFAIADHGRIVYANAAFAELFAYSDRVEMSGKALSSLRPRSHQYERTSLGSSPASESGRRVCEFLGRRKDGTKVQVESSCSPFRAQGRDLLNVPTSAVEKLRSVHDLACQIRTRMAGAE